MRDALANFGEVRAMLIERGSPCLVAQLDVAEKGVGFPPCPLIEGGGGIASTGSSVRRFIAK